MRLQCVVPTSVVNFLFVVIEFICYLLWLRHYKWRSVEVGVLRKGVGHFRLKGYFLRHCDIMQFMLTQSSQCLLLWSYIADMIKYHILRHQKTHSRHIKCVNNFKGVGNFEAKLMGW